MSLSATFIEATIQKILEEDESLQQMLRKNGLSLLHTSDNDDERDPLMMTHIESATSNMNDPSYLGLKTPWHFSFPLFVHDTAETFAGLSFYLAYSTWNGRILYVDRLNFPKLDVDDDAVTELILLRSLARIALALNCARLTWRHSTTPDWHTNGSNQPEMYGEVLTLSMDEVALDTYLSSSNLEIPSSKEPFTGTFSHTKLDLAINQCLSKINLTSKQFRLRLATENDLPTVGRLVQGLADYVKEPDAVHISVEDYRKDGFTEEEPLFYCLLVEAINESTDDFYPCGYAFTFFGYRQGEGRFLYLEDLFLEVAHRQKGGGNLVMKALALICQSLQCKRLVWQALDWNTSGLQFYNKIGAKIHEGEKTSRHAGDALVKFAKSGPE